MCVFMRQCVSPPYAVSLDTASAQVTAKGPASFALRNANFTAVVKPSPREINNDAMISRPLDWLGSGGEELGQREPAGKGTQEPGRPLPPTLPAFAHT